MTDSSNQTWSGTVPVQGDPLTGLVGVGFYYGVPGVFEDVFDTNHDGALDSGDADFADFYVMVTNATGTETAYSLAQLGIASINLNANAASITLPDGSAITGETTYATSMCRVGKAAKRRAHAAVPRRVRLRGLRCAQPTLLLLRGDRRNGDITELFDVAVISDVRCPRGIGPYAPELEEAMRGEGMPR